MFLTFDIEDPITPASDDALLWIAADLTAAGAPATFFLTGEKARVLMYRGRRDVVAALAPHAVGFHTDKHSVHPTVSEYLADLGWRAGIEEVTRREAPGVHAVGDLLGRAPSAFATPGTSWGPQVPAALSRLGLRAHVHSFSRLPSAADPHWYAGGLCFSRAAALGPLENHLADPMAAEAQLARVRSAVAAARERPGDVVHLFVGHPTIFVNRTFWDAHNYAGGRNPPPGERLATPTARPRVETAQMLAALRRLVAALRAEPGLRFVTVDDLIAEAAVRVPAYEPDRLAPAVDRAARDGLFGMSGRLSPAQLVFLLSARLVGGRALPAEGTPVPEVVGPVPGRVDPGPAGSVAGERLAAAARAVVAAVTESGGLPAVPAGLPISSVGSALLQEAAGRLPAGRTVPPSDPDPWPPVGDEIAAYYIRRSSGWLHAPDLDPRNAADLARWQAWSLRDAGLVGR